MKKDFLSLTIGIQVPRAKVFEGMENGRHRQLVLWDINNQFYKFEKISTATECQSVLMEVNEDKYYLLMDDYSDLPAQGKRSVTDMKISVKLSAIRVNPTSCYMPLIRETLAQFKEPFAPCMIRLMEQVIDRGVVQLSPSYPSRAEVIAKHKGYALKNVHALCQNIRLLEWFYAGLERALFVMDTFYSAQEQQKFKEILRGQDPDKKRQVMRDLTVPLADNLNPNVLDFGELAA